MKKVLQLLTVSALAGLMFQSCVSDPDSPGLEYMPDMYRSPAVEAYVDYGMDAYIIGVDSAEAQRATQSARLPVAGTIEFGAEFMPYPYANTFEDYERAGTELKSPIPMNQENVEHGKVLFERMCSHCHGKKGAGDGKLVENEKILGVPNFAVQLATLPEGKMYHSITYGKGIMGSHAAQLEPMERWQIIQYIKVMQKGGDMPKFDDKGMAIGFDSNVAAEPAADDVAMNEDQAAE